MNSHIARLVFRVSVLVSLAGSALAQSSANTGASRETVQATAGDSWTWRVAPYLWAAGIDGTVTTGATEVDFEVDFGDIWDNLESAGLLVVEARRDQFSVVADVVYLGLDLDGETPGGADADADVDTTILQLVGLYRVAPTSPYEVGLGMRYFSMDTELEVGVISADSDHSSFDGFAAGRASWPFAGRWNMTLYGDVGAGDSDLTWQGSALLGYRVSNWGLGVGYRAIDYDFEEGNDELDLTLEGLLFGVEFWL